MEVEVVRLMLYRVGRFPMDEWKTDVRPIAVAEVSDDVTAQELIAAVKAENAHIPRCEIGLVGWGVGA